MSGDDQRGDDQRGEDEGGDDVCWLSELCPECGAMPSGDGDRCWRCGASRADAT